MKVCERGRRKITESIGKIKQEEKKKRKKITETIRLQLHNRRSVIDTYHGQ